MATTQELMRQLSLKVRFPRLPPLEPYPDVNRLQELYNRLRQKIRIGASSSRPDEFIQYIGMRQFIVRFANRNDFSALRLRRRKARHEDLRLASRFQNNGGTVDLYCRVTVEAYNWLRRETQKEYKNLRYPPQRTVMGCKQGMNPLLRGL